MATKILLVLAAIMLFAGCSPKMVREVNGEETYCYLCLGYYHSFGKKDLDTKVNATGMFKILNKNKKEEEK